MLSMCLAQYLYVTVIVGEANRRLAIVVRAAKLQDLGELLSPSWLDLFQDG
jgi:hypothetical protein